MLEGQCPQGVSRNPAFVSNDTIRTVRSSGETRGSATLSHVTSWNAAASDKNPGGI